MAILPRSKWWVNICHPELRPEYNQRIQEYKTSPGGLGVLVF